MQKPLLEKGIAVAVIVLFIGISVIPSTGTVVKQSSMWTAFTFSPSTK